MCVSCAEQEGKENGTTSKIRNRARIPYLRKRFYIAFDPIPAQNNQRSPTQPLRSLRRFAPLPEFRPRFPAGVR
jgi:hypothetical protein